MEASVFPCLLACLLPTAFADAPDATDAHPAPRALTTFGAAVYNPARPGLSGTITHRRTLGEALGIEVSGSVALKNLGTFDQVVGFEAVRVPLAAQEGRLGLALGHRVGGGPQQELFGYIEGAVGSDAMTRRTFDSLLDQQLEAGPAGLMTELGAGGLAVLAPGPRSVVALRLRAGVHARFSTFADGHLSPRRRRLTTGNFDAPRDRVGLGVVAHQAVHVLLVPSDALQIGIGTGLTTVMQLRRISGASPTRTHWWEPGLDATYRF